MVEGTILLLGSGMCAPPLVEYLAKAGFRLVIATRTTSKTESIVAKTGKVDIPIEVVKYDIEEDFKKDLISLDELVHRVDPDVLVSLLPWIYHVPAAKLALKKKKHFCTASYVSEDMQALDDDVKKAGLFFLNECGVDPGLDHMSAMRIIDQVKAKGGKIISFKSICGGLPAPDYNDNPLGYKLSWSPRGVLLASNNNALIRMNGEQIEVKGENLFEEKNCHTLVEESLGDLEWYYNRDSVKYGDIYNIADSKTIIRGTFRFPGWCRMMDAFKRLGVTSLDSIAELKGLSAFEATKIVLSCKDLNPQDFISSQLKLSTDDDIIKRLEWLGMFDNSLIVDQSVQTPLDFMSWLFERSLVYASGEKDMIVMRHEFEVEYEHKHREQIISSLIDFGLQPDNYSSMARTVSLPLAVAIVRISSCFLVV